MRKKYKVAFLFLTMVISMAFNVFFIYVKYESQIKVYFYKKNFKPIQTTDYLDFERMLRQGTIKRLNSEYVVGSKHYKHGFKDFFNCEQISVYEFGEYGYLLYYTWKYAVSRNDKALMHLVKSKFDYAFCDSCGLQYPINRIDQSSYGLIGIELYLHTNDIKYKLFCNEIVTKLKKRDVENGIILYSSDGQQNVDALGLSCPFMLKYADCFNDTSVYTMADKMIKDFIKRGCDAETGLPCESYNIETGIKTRFANWGRGTSWFLLGLDDYKNKKDVLLNNRISRCDSTLLKIGPLYSQFIELGNSPTDMSSTIPILYYLITNNYMSMSKTDYINLIKDFTGQDGIIYFNSPSIAMPNEKPNCYQPHDLTQGIALYTLTLLH